MQFIPLCLFTIICGYSLVISAPINLNSPDVEEIKHQKASAIASRLLSEIIGEQLTVQSSNNDNIVPETQQKDEEENEYIPTIDDVYPYYGNKYTEDDGDDYFLQPSNQQFLKYLEEQLDSKEHLKPVTNTQIMDDSLMKTEDR